MLWMPSIIRKLRLEIDSAGHSEFLSLTPCSLSRLVVSRFFFSCLGEFFFFLRLGNYLKQSAILPKVVYKVKIIIKKQYSRMKPPCSSVPHQSPTNDVTSITSLTSLCLHVWHVNDGCDVIGGRPVQQLHRLVQLFSSYFTIVLGSRGVILSLRQRLEYFVADNTFI